MITAYAILKKAAANANRAGKRLDDQRHQLIITVCGETLTGESLAAIALARPPQPATETR
jgi:fumarate hydratase class II